MTRSHAGLPALVMIAALFGPAAAGAQRAVAENPVIPEPDPVPVDIAAPAVTPSVIFYQGRLTDAGGTPRSGPVTLAISLYAGASSATPLWTETHTLVPLTDGVFSLLLGSLTPFPVNAWTDPDRFLGISVDGTPELTPRLRLASVPFAMEANRLNGKRSTDFDTFGSAAIAAAGLASQLNGSDGDPPNSGSNQVHWNNLYGMPAGFADGVDSVGAGVTVHGQLTGLSANDHPQYALNSVLQVSDGSAPNLGSNRVHWDNLGGVPAPLVSQQLPKEWITAGSLDSTRVAAGGLRGANMALESIGADRLVPASIGSLQVADGSLSGIDIQNESVTGTDIQNGSLTGLDIQDESILTNDITNGTILGVDVALSTITGAHIEDGSINAEDLAPGIVTGMTLADSSIAGQKLVTGAVGPRELANNTVDGSKVVDGSLGAAELKEPPGVAFRNLTGFAATVDSTSGQDILAVTMNSPGPGFVIVHGAAQVFLLHDIGMASTVTLALSTVSGDVPDSTNAEIALPGSFSSELYIFPVVTQNVFPVQAAGPVTFYLTAKKGTQVRDPSLHDVRIQATYVPREY